MPWIRHSQFFSGFVSVQLPDKFMKKSQAPSNLAKSAGTGSDLGSVIDGLLIKYATVNSMQSGTTGDGGVIELFSSPESETAVISEPAAPGRSEPAAPGRLEPAAGKVPSSEVGSVKVVKESFIRKPQVLAFDNDDNWLETHSAPKGGRASKKALNKVAPSTVFVKPRPKFWYRALDDDDTSGNYIYTYIYDC